MIGKICIQSCPLQCIASLWRNDAVCFGWVAWCVVCRCMGCRAKVKLTRLVDATEVQLLRTEHCTCNDR